LRGFLGGKSVEWGWNGNVYETVFIGEDLNGNASHSCYIVVDKMEIMNGAKGKSGKKTTEKQSPNIKLMTQRSSQFGFFSFRNIISIRFQT
jgi:hypothetical protein